MLCCVQTHKWVGYQQSIALEVEAYLESEEKRARSATEGPTSEGSNSDYHGLPDQQQPGTSSALGEQSDSRKEGHDRGGSEQLAAKEKEGRQEPEAWGEKPLQDEEPPKEDEVPIENHLDIAKLKWVTRKSKRKCSRSMWITEEKVCVDYTSVPKVNRYKQGWRENVLDVLHPRSLRKKSNAEEQKKDL